MSAPINCADCGAPMVLRDSRFGPFYGCTRYPACTGKHGAHPDGRPLGNPANAATREARIRAHAAFDRLWQDGGLTRDDAYAWLRSALGMSKRECHIAKFDEVQCARVVDLVERYCSDD